MFERKMYKKNVILFKREEVLRIETKLSLQKLSKYCKFRGYAKKNIYEN